MTFTKIRKEFITAENINELFAKYDMPKEPDLVSIDIDGNDYRVWKNLTDYSPRVVIIEFNSSFAVDENKIQKYDATRVWDGTYNYGSSLLALKNLGESK